MPYSNPSPVSPYDLKCYCVEFPDNPDYERALFGALLSLTRWTSWERDLDHSALQIAEYVGSVLLPQFSRGFMCCCDTYNSGQLVNLANLQQAQYLISLDTGTVASFAPDAPDTSFSSDTGDTTSDLEQKRLNALCGAVRAYMLMELHYWADLTNTAAVVESAIAGGIFLIPGVGVIAGVVAAIAVGLTAAKIHSILADDAAANLAICDMYNGLLGQDITFDNFKAALSGAYGVDGSNEDTLTVWLNAANQKTENYHAFVAFLGTSFEGSVSSPDATCECGDCEIPMKITTGNATLRDLHDCVYQIDLPPGTPVFVNIERVDGLCFHAGSWSWSNVNFGANFEPCGGGADLPYFGGLEGSDMQQLKIYNNHAGVTTVTFTVSP